MYDRIVGLFRVIVLLVTLCVLPQAGRSDQTIYDDALVNSWQSWGWATLNYNSTNYVHSGTKAISVSGGAYEAIYLHHSAFNSASYTNLTFWINGGAAGGQLLQVQALINGTAQTIYNLPALQANTWTKYIIPFSALGLANTSGLDGFWWQDRSGGIFQPFYLDDIQLVAVPVVVGPMTITIDGRRNRHAIDPRIYGVAFASSNDVADLNVPLNRSGGNATTRYNWQQNSFQTAFDWFFQSLPYDSAVPGENADTFITDSRAGGAEPMITIPMIGWAADVTTNRVKRWSFSVAKYGAQTETEASRTGYAPWASTDAGNGIAQGSGQFITNNNLLDANMPVTSTFQKGWIQHLTNRWGTASTGGLRYYLLDNEMSIWHSTHRDVVKTGINMEQSRDRMIEYASMIKQVDPGATIFGPEEWGWAAFLLSGYDQQVSDANGYTSFPDKAAHGNWDYLPWLLDQLRRTNNATGQRLLDVCSVHYYPQGGEFSTNVTTDLQMLRNRSTRSLWDPSYVDESWISTPVYLIPRLKSWISTNYAGTKTAITEYSWGAENHINGATAQADVLGIFGREGLDMATRWTSPENTTPVYKAIKMYRNYDNNKSTFGSMGVFGDAPNPDEVSVFAAIRTNDLALTVMLINKAFTTNAVNLRLTNYLAMTTASVWQLNASNTIAHLPNITNITNQLSYTLPAQSITLFVIPPRIPAKPRLDVGGVFTNQFVFSLVGEAGVPYVLQSSTNLAAWTSVSTNVLTTNYMNVFVPMSPQKTFYRAVWEP